VAALEKPVLDACARPLCRVDAAAILVEEVAVCVLVGCCYAAAVIAVVGVAICVQQCVSCCRAGYVYGAAGVGV